MVIVMGELMEIIFGDNDIPNNSVVIYLIVLVIVTVWD
jgi:hypothetical protein